MFDEEFFSLKLFRMSPSEEWPFRHGGLYFIFPQKGVGQYVNGSATQRLMPGDILIKEGNPTAKICGYERSEIAFWSFSLRLEHLIPLFGGNEISLLQGVFDSFKSSRLIAGSSALAVKCHRLIEEVPAQFDLEHRSLLLHIAAAILNEEFKLAHQKRSRSGHLAGHVFEVFEQLSVDELLDLSAEELASKFGCCQRHLNRLFHRYFGVSVGALRREMRLQKAASLLRDVNAKVVNVAEQSGFNHLGLFNTYFKKRFGISPSEWRKQAIDGQTLPGLPAGELRLPLIPSECQRTAPLSA